jgi:adenylate kinase
MASRPKKVENQDKKPLSIVLIGDPAAGKATQSAFLVKKYKLYDFDMGKELNIRRAKNKNLDNILKGNTDKGNLTPTQIVRAIHQEMMKKIPAKQGILYDGHPKMLGEAKLAAKLLKQYKRAEPIVLYLSIPLEETVKRMHDRQGYFKGKFGKRADDSDAALKNRARYYRVNIAAVVKYFSTHFKYKKVNALGSVAQVRSRVEKAVADFLNNS